MEYYGSLTTRLEENNQFVDEIKIGTGVTEYLWSDMRAYEVVAVADQKHITIREYDHILKGDAGSNDWELIQNPNNPAINLVKRGMYWYEPRTCTQEDLSYAEEMRNAGDIRPLLSIVTSGFDENAIRKKGKHTKYIKRNISVGEADYYYDYSF